MVTGPDSAVPMVGASGAISGVMGGYLVLYPRVRVFTMIPMGFFLQSVALPAWVMLLYWLGLQFVSGPAILGREPAAWPSGPTSAASSRGVVLVQVFARPDYVAAHRARHWRPQRVMWG